MTWALTPQSGEDNGPSGPEVPTLAELRDNLLQVRNHTHFNIGSPQAIDHLLITIVAVIDALEEHHKIGGTK